MYIAYHAKRRPVSSEWKPLHELSLTYLLHGEVVLHRGHVLLHRLRHGLHHLVRPAHVDPDHGGVGGADAEVGQSITSALYSVQRSLRIILIKI